MRLTKYGFRLNLLGFSSILSVLGMVYSIFGIAGGIAIIAVGTYYFSGKNDVTIGSHHYYYSAEHYYDEIIALRALFCGVGAGVLIIMILYLVMWIFLHKKTRKQDITGIERIVKVYSYVLVSLEIIVQIASLIGLTSFLVITHGFGYYPTIAIILTSIILTSISLIFACLKIHGIRVENNKLLGAYLCFRYTWLILSTILFIIVSIMVTVTPLPLIGLIFNIPCLILDIGLTVILHSIRVDRENNTEAEILLNNF